MEIKIDIEKARRLAQEFLDEEFIDARVSVTRVDISKKEGFFNVYFQDVRALAGDDRFALNGNVPVIVDSDGSVYFDKTWSPYGKRQH